MDYPRYERFIDNVGEWRFRLRDRNFEIILASSEGYLNKFDCTAAISICQRNSPHERFYSRRVTTRWEYYFTLQADNGRDIGRSHDYNSVSSREQGIGNVKRDGSTTIVIDV